MVSNYPEKVYLNDKIVDTNDANISVFDRGFLFGDGIYEVMVQINGQFFYEKEHLNRLDYCLKEINIKFDVDALMPKIENLLKISNLQEKDCLLYVQVTRGTAPRTHAFPKNTKPTVMMYAMPKTLPDINNNHLQVITNPDFRWHRCDLKTISLLGNVMINDLAVSHKAYEAIFIRDGLVTEATHCNVFFVKDQTVYTHPANHHILNGVTRIIVLQLCKALGIQLKEVAVKEKDIYKMDEVFLTGTTTQIASVNQINNHAYYENNEIGPITKQLQEAFLNLKQNFNN